MNNKTKKTTDKTKLQVMRLKWQIIIVFAGVMVAVTILLAVIIAQRAGETMQMKTASLISNNTSQQVMNVDNYLQKIKTATSLFFSEEIYYTYDATSDELDEFEKIQRENAIVNRIQDLGVLENYEDFAVVYANNHTVGWASDSTYKIFADGDIYEGLNERISKEANDAGWFSDDLDEYRNLYYAKRLNKNAILFVSFYRREIESVFEVPDDMQGNLTIRLVNEDSTVLYSTDKSEIGVTLNKEISSLIDGSTDNVILNSDYLITSNRCSTNRWSVVCTIPTDVIMKEMYEVKTFIYFISFIMFFLMLVFGIVILSRVSDPMNKIISSLTDKAEHDQLTGLLNKVSFENIISALMQKGTGNEVDVFVMIDMDNFKTVNDTMGHETGDKVLMRISTLIKKHFDAEAISGRLGGDEFAVFFRFTDDDRTGVRTTMQKKMQTFKEAFNEEFADEAESCSLSLSAGVAITGQGEMSFEQIYKSADTALYKSKKSGKNRITFY